MSSFVPVVTHLARSPSAPIGVTLLRPCLRLLGGDFQTAPGHGVLVPTREDRKPTPADNCQNVCARLHPLRTPPYLAAGGGTRRPSRAFSFSRSLPSPLTYSQRYMFCA